MWRATSPMGSRTRASDRPALAACDRRRDDHLITIGQRCLRPLEQAHILTVDVDVHESARLTRLVQHPLAHAGIARTERLNSLTHGSRRDLDQLLAIRPLTQRPRESYSYCHNRCLLLM